MVSVPTMRECANRTPIATQVASPPIPLEPTLTGWLGSPPPCIQTTARLRAVELSSEPGNRFGEYLGLPAITLKTIVSGPRSGLVELQPPW
jgi:hypothetical protein